MSNHPLKAREIEALTFIYGAPEPVNPVERSRGSKFSKWTWVKLRKLTLGPHRTGAVKDVRA